METPFVLLEKSFIQFPSFKTYDILIFCFWDQGQKLDNQQNMFSIFGSMFSTTIFSGMNNASAVHDPGLAQERTAHRQVQVQHHHHHYHHHHHHVHDMNEKEQLSDHNSLSIRSNASASHFGSSNVVTTPVEGNAAKFGLNTSASGSNNRSGAENGRNGQNANKTVGIAGAVMAGENEGSRKCGGEDLLGSGRKSGLDQNQSALRAAALDKFRQKRKDRCFDKKVRYHNRKRLAEQRPRVKGQFVRQVVVEDKYKSKPGNVQRASCIVVHARRRIRYDEDDEEEGEGNDYGNNEDVAMLEYYSESVKEIALLVKAEVDEQQVEILIFKGFSSSLSHSTSPDPSRSILPARAKIKSIDRIKGPFNPSNIEYIEKGISLEAFRSQFLSK